MARPVLSPCEGAGRRLPPRALPGRGFPAPRPPPGEASRASRRAESRDVANARADFVHPSFASQAFGFCHSPMAPSLTGLLVTG